MALVVRPAKMFNSSLIFLAAIILKIYMTTKMLKKIVRWRDGVMSLKAEYMLSPIRDFFEPLNTNPVKVW